MIFGKLSAFITACCLLPGMLLAQGTIGNSGTTTNGSSGGLPTAVPFLTIAPDSRSGAMGDAGVALSPDVNANYWNPSKLTFIDEPGQDQASLSYSPWLRNLVGGINLAYLSYAHRLDQRNTIGASLRYFNLGSVQLVDANQNSQGTYTPNEFSIDGSFARKFGQNFSLGLTLRYIHSGIASGGSLNGQQVNSGNAVATDVSGYYQKYTRQFGKEALLAFGLNMSNIGTKIGYTMSGKRYFLPANLRLGVADTWTLDQVNTFTVAFDLNKLLVPTPPIRNSSGNIIRGYDDDRSIPSGVFGSFGDAPGGFREELHEISYAGGVEYGYDKQLFLRAGYYYENPNKGNRQYGTLGAGYKYDIFRFDLSYLVATQQKSALANTLRFTVIANFGSK
ncbi:type IX secretion system outer membrane channel protein PorV [Mucilaginibacter daejeonensis]|uniref:type IX secretion system outer membrane channel protein PorV n=1 Tax=Mucilaginibacter daejeonensis TaxID=398049 RepID=UPI001D174155|nr:type IX secretion system outer membrane channel protein PorV [Mucilaginibacter daejeonensis]UEG52889.1 type IX secretion system outer membrane channel protein PorV [Mucilaginibacter daejeonensis]